MAVSRKTDLWQSLLSLGQLDCAWDRVRSNAGAAGGDGLPVPAFQAGAGRRIAQIATQLACGEWRPLPYLMEA